MTRYAKTLVALTASLCVLGLAPVARASADSTRSGPAGHHSGSITPGRRAASGPQTWHVLAGAQSQNDAIQAEGYYPHVITIDAGDTVVWTLNTDEIHSVTFAGTCEDISCVPPCVFTVNIDISPCGSPTYDGVSALDSSGRMVPAAYNWDNAYPHGGTTYALTFTQPGVDVYFDLSVSGMRGVVVVNPAGTPYPFTQQQYSEQAQEQLQSDLAAAAWAEHHDHPVMTSASADGTRTYHIALGANPPERAGVFLSPAGDSAAAGLAFLEGSGVGTSPTPAIDVSLRLFGLQPGSVHAVQILPGVCGAPAPTTGLIYSQLFNPPAFTLNSVTAGPDGTATSTTALTEPPSSNGPGLLRIPSSGWFINVAAGPNPDNDATSVVCGNIVFHNASVMRYQPQDIHVRVGDTVVWANDTINEIHGVTFLAGQPLPPLPDWYFSSPTGNGVAYDGSSFFNSGPLYAPDAGRNQSLTLTFTKPGTFPYIDVEDSVLGMQGNVIVAPPDSPAGPAGRLPEMTRGLEHAQAAGAPAHR
jgi:plastocyanin